MMTNLFRIQRIVLVPLLMVAAFQGCSNRNPKALPEFIVSKDAITLADRELTEEEFLKTIASLKSKHKVICDVHDQESSRYVNEVFVPNLLQILNENPKLQNFVEIEVREE